MTFEDAVKWLEEVPLYGHKDGIRNMVRLMEAFGHPERKLRILHVAGTNGKGSCCAMLESVLRNAGFRTGLYTSPHLIDYRERIRIGGEMISREDFVRILSAVREQNDRLVALGYPHATFYEFLTATAFVYYAERKVDFAVIETGVGGRLDATNVVEKPLLCLITSISRDHMKVLGNTIPGIAAEKAGILKADTAAVAAYNPEEALMVLRERAQAVGCALTEVPGDRLRIVSESEDGLRLAFTEPEARMPRQLNLPLVGRYQAHNVAAVLAAVQILRTQGIMVPCEAVAEGLETVRWPGRMEFRTFRGRRFLLEGAHNEDGARWLGRYLAERRRPVWLIFGALAKKDTRALLTALTCGGAVRGILFARLEDDGAMTEEAFRNLCGELAISLPVRTFASTALAAEWALANTEEEPIVCTGSLYLVGEVMKWMEA